MSVRAAPRGAAMKDLLERVLKELPGYLPDLTQIVSRPKPTIARLVDAAGGDLARPLIFVAVTVGFGFLLQLPQLGKEHDFATLVAGMAVFKVLALHPIEGMSYATTTGENRKWVVKINNHLYAGYQQVGI